MPPKPGFLTSVSSDNSLKEKKKKNYSNLSCVKMDTKVRPKKNGKNKAIRIVIACSMYSQKPAISLPLTGIYSIYLRFQCQTSSHCHMYPFLKAP